jgi:hypothetical protein
MPANFFLPKGGKLGNINFHYRSAIGQLNYLSSSSRPELMMAVHQCMHYSNNPRLNNEKWQNKLSNTLSIPRITDWFCFPISTKDVNSILMPIFLEVSARTILMIHQHATLAMASSFGMLVAP